MSGTISNLQTLHNNHAGKINILLILALVALGIFVVTRQVIEYYYHEKPCPLLETRSRLTGQCHTIHPMFSPKFDGDQRDFVLIIFQNESRDEAYFDLRRLADPKSADEASTATPGDDWMAIEHYADVFDTPSTDKLRQRIRVPLNHLWQLKELGLKTMPTGVYLPFDIHVRGPRNRTLINAFEIRKSPTSEETDGTLTLTQAITEPTASFPYRLASKILQQPGTNADHAAGVVLLSIGDPDSSVGN